MSKSAVIVGGGPAGLMAAEVLATAGVSVTIYEHKRSAGRKFLLAGRGGLNITHSEALAELLARYGPASPRLRAAVSAFTPNDLRAWCATHGEPTFEGTSGRVFPESFRATPLLRAWLHRLAELGVALETEHRWQGWADDGSLNFVGPDGPITVSSDVTVFALGGASWPRVGSDGRWADEFARTGIDVKPLAAANSGVIVHWSDVLRERFAGAPIKNTIFTVGDHHARGDAVITDAGIEGGPIYALGPALRERVGSAGHADLVLDLHPDISLGQLTARLSKRRAKASTASWLKSAGVSQLSSSLAREVTDNHLPDTPAELAALLKALPIAVAAMAPIERAISTAGGVSFDEVDDSFMLHRRPGTFVAGEMLDWEAPTGGYLLQACFSTAVAAARGALDWLETR